MTQSITEALLLDDVTHFNTLTKTFDSAQYPIITSLLLTASDSIFTSFSATVLYLLLFLP